MKILVRATNWVGDAVMSIPALECIRARWPNADIAIYARQGIADLYRGQAFANRVLPLDATYSVGFLPAERAAAALLREQFDLAIILPNSFASAWPVWRAGIRERIGYARDGRHWLLTRAIQLPRAREIPPHECYYYLELLRRAGWLEALPPVKAICLHAEAASLDRAEEMLQQAGASGRASGQLRVVVAPGASYGAAKCWPPERYANLADRLIAEFDAGVVLCGTAAEREISAAIAARMRNQPVNLAGQTVLGDLPGLFASCDLFVGNDSGAMHVAAAVGLPVVAIFGPTDPEGTAPITLQRTIVRRPVSCSPCFLRRCPVDHRCMRRLDEAEVYEAARQRIMNGSRNRVPR